MRRARIRARAAVDAERRAGGDVLPLARAGALDGRREWHPWVGLQMVGYARGAGLRVLLGAFGDPGHAFPVIALGVRAGRARPRGRDRDLGALARAVRGRGDGVLARARVPGLPDARAAAEALRGRRAGRARHARVRARLRARRRGLGHPHRARPRWRRSSRACRWRRVVPHVHPDLPPGLPAVLDRGAAAAHARRRAAVAAADRAVAVGLEQGRGEFNDCRARLGLAPLPWTCTPGSRASLTMVATLPQLEYPRGVAVVGARRRAAAVGARRAARGAASRRRTRSCWSRPRRRRTRRARCCGRAWTGWRTSRCG